MNDVLNVIKNRRSVRKYKPKQLSDEELNMILEAGLYAPSAHNEQPWYFTVIQNKTLLDAINTRTKEIMMSSDSDWIKKMGSQENFRVTYNAPTLIIVSGKSDAMAYQADCAAAIQNMLLAAESLNIGSVWLGLPRLIFDQDDLLEQFNIPQGYLPYYAISFGYKLNDAPRKGPSRNKDVIHIIK